VSGILTRVAQEGGKDMSKVKISTETGIKGDDIGPEVIYYWYSPEVKCRGVVVIDTTAFGLSVGGTRMLPDITTNEIVSLARAMTYKYISLGRSRGGGKAGIWADPNMQRSQREAIMRAYGRAIKPLVQAGTFSPGADMGVSHADMVWVREETGQEAALPKFWLEEKDGESLDYHFTGYGVVVAAQAACDFMKMDISRATVAIEGFGKVASGVARYADQLGAKVVAISTIRGAIYNERGLDVNKLIELRKSFGDDLVLKYDGAKTINKEDLFYLPVDILVPGSRPWVINENNVDKVKAKLISSGANIPITKEAEERLFQRGITVIPDFISNSGGALSSHIGRLDVNSGEAFEAIKRIMRNSVLELMEVASREKISPTKLAKQRATDTFRKWKAEGAPPDEEYTKKLKEATGVS